MDFAKKHIILLAVILISLTGIVTAADRMVIGELVTSTT
jgi:hypothetical protein